MTGPKPRLIDLFGKPKKPRSLVTHDGTMIVEGEAHRIWNEPMAFDERPKLSRNPVTFDGAMPPATNPKDPANA